MREASLSQEELSRIQKTWASHFGINETYVNSIGAKLCLVPPGAFFYGHPDPEVRFEIDLESVSVGRKEVELSRAFWIGEAEITLDQWFAIERSDPTSFRKLIHESRPLNGIDFGKLPVESITWFDAVRFCNGLSRREGLPPFYEISDEEWIGKRLGNARVRLLGGNGYRLPTSAEAEYAARAGKRTDYYWGDEFDDKLADAGLLDRPHVAGMFPPNHFGLYDTLDNMQEWCHDGLKHSESMHPETDPIGGLFRSPAFETRRLLGGSWADKNSRFHQVWHYSDAHCGFLSSLVGMRIARYVE